MLYARDMLGICFPVLCNLSDIKTPWLFFVNISGRRTVSALTRLTFHALFVSMEVNTGYIKSLLFTYYFVKKFNSIYDVYNLWRCRHLLSYLDCNGTRIDHWEDTCCFRLRVNNSVDHGILATPPSFMTIDDKSKAIDIFLPQTKLIMIVSNMIILYF